MKSSSRHFQFGRHSFTVKCKLIHLEKVSSHAVTKHLLKIVQPIGNKGFRFLLQNQIAGCQSLYIRTLVKKVQAIQIGEKDSVSCNTVR